MPGWPAVTQHGVRRTRLALFIALATLGACASVASADTEQLACGAVVTHDVTLAGDMSCFDPSTPAVVVGADGITIDLGGHTVSGFRDGVGIENDGHRGVVIRDGTISAFAQGVGLDNAVHNRLVRLTLSGQRFDAIRMDGGSFNVVRRTVVNNSDFGSVLVRSSPYARIVDNTITTDFTAGLGLLSDHSIVAHNTFAPGAVGGITVTGSSNLMVGNHVGGTGLIGIDVASGDRNVLLRNQLSQLSDGVLVEAPATHTWVIRNTADGANHDGILIQSPSALLIGNIANDNANYGIEAVPGVFAFGNRASGNGNPAQCINVRCR
jgi:Right handed beta helix region